MVGTVHLGMAILAALANDEAAACRIRIIEVQEAAHVAAPLGANVLVTLLAELGPLPVQQCFVIGAVGLVAQGTVLGHRVVFPEERPALLGVAGITGIVDAELLQCGRAG